MMQVVLPDQAKIRRSLAFVNKIEARRGKEMGGKIHTGMYCRNIPVCIGETYRYVLTEHTGMFGRYIPVCFLGRWGEGVSWDGRAGGDACVFTI